ncbi:MAG: class I SAM-dependent methyltransferase [Pseudohongiellaceae bacterium]
MQDLSEEQLPRASTDAIARYYDANTERFLKLGGSGDAAAIHRAIWAPEVRTRSHAFVYLNALVANAISPIIREDAAALHLLDLGCGVGGTATWLAQALGIRVTGITLSSAQVSVAQERALRLGVADRVKFLLGDFSAMPDLPQVQAACAIESFVHAASAPVFFAMAARQIEAGGRLVICDDFLNPPLGPQAQRWTTRFATGWHLNNLIPTQNVIEAALTAGFRLVEERDLSPWIKPFNPVLLWSVTTLTRLPLKWAYWQNLSGGTALQVCLKNGWTVYRALIFERI